MPRIQNNQPLWAVRAPCKMTMHIQIDPSNPKRLTIVDTMYLPRTESQSGISKRLKAASTRSIHCRKEMVDHHLRESARSRYPSHLFLAMSTVARPSSRFSVPSGFPIVMANSQKTAAIHEKKAKHMLNSGAVTCTTINLKTPNSKLWALSTEGAYNSCRCLRYIGQIVRITDRLNDQSDRHKQIGDTIIRITKVHMVKRQLKRLKNGSSDDIQN
jgi:hypothetical protein